MITLLDLCVSSLRRGHANLLCIVPILTDDPRRESSRYNVDKWLPALLWNSCSYICAGKYPVISAGVMMNRLWHCQRWDLHWLSSPSNLLRRVLQGFGAFLLIKLPGNGPGCSQSRQNWRKITVKRYWVVNLKLWWWSYLSQHHSFSFVWA